LLANPKDSLWEALQLDEEGNINLNIKETECKGLHPWKGLHPCIFYPVAGSCEQKLSAGST